MPSEDIDGPDSAELEFIVLGNLVGSVHVEEFGEFRVEIQISDSPEVPGRFEVKYIVNESEDRLGQMLALLSFIGPGTGVAGPSKICA